MLLYADADDLALAAQDREFGIVKERLSNALDEPKSYYKGNHLCKNPSKTRVHAYYLQNKKVNPKLNVSWSGTLLKKNPPPL